MQNKGELHKGHRQRLKQRAINSGIENMPLHEILELILTYTIPYKDVNPLAHSLINHFGSYANVFDAGYDQLINFNGVGHETALFLSLFPKFCRIYTESKHGDKIILNNTNDCIAYLKSIVSSSNVEEAYVFCLDGNKKLLRKQCFTSNLSFLISIDNKKFANSLLDNKTKYLIMMHTHPFGNTLPSKADVLATSEILKMCRMFGITLIDHIIVGDGEYYSFNENNLFDRNSQEMLINEESYKPVGIAKQIVVPGNID